MSLSLYMTTTDQWADLKGCLFYIDRCDDAFFSKNKVLLRAADELGLRTTRDVIKMLERDFSQMKLKPYSLLYGKRKKTSAALCSFIIAQEAKREENRSPMARVCALFSLTLSTSLCAFQNWTKVLVSKETAEPRETLCYLSTRSWQLTNRRQFLMRLSVYWTWISS